MIELVKKHRMKFLVLAFFLPSFLFFGSLYWQYVLGEQPCTLCIIQRLLMLCLMVWALLPFLIKQLRDRVALPAIAMLLSGLALAANIWQIALIWAMQSTHRPLFSGICAVGTAPENGVLGWAERFFMASGGDCAQSSPIWLGLPVVYWLTGIFLFLMGLHAVYWVSLRYSKTSHDECLV